MLGCPAFVGRPYFIFPLFLLPQFRTLLVRVLAADFSLSLILDRVCLFLFGEGRLKMPN